MKLNRRGRLHPVNGGVNSAGKYKSLDRLVMLVEGGLVPNPDLRPADCRWAGNKVQLPFQTAAHWQVVDLRGRWR